MASDIAFADASFFFAFAAKQDRTHQVAVGSFRRLVKAGGRIITTDYVLDEALTLTKTRANATVSLQLLDRIEKSSIIAIERVDPDRFESAKGFFRKHADHGYSFTDCTSFVVMRELEIKDALTTDRHFAEAGFRLLLRPGRG